MSLRFYIAELLLGIAVLISAISAYVIIKRMAYEMEMQQPPKLPGTGYDLNEIIVSKRTSKDAFPKLNPPVTNTPLRIIAIIDTGFDEGRLRDANVRLCGNGQYDATRDTYEIGYDSQGHGTIMAYLAAFAAQKTNYCILTIKAIDLQSYNEEHLVRALKHVLKQVPTIVSMSFSKRVLNFTELLLLKKLSSKDVVMFASAGNNNHDLSNLCTYYPACYNVPNLYVIGAFSSNKAYDKASYSNFGNKVSFWYFGQAFGMSGTSVSTALAAGSYAVSLNEVGE